MIVFAPHPDDETLGCGGTIIKRLMEGYDVVVVVMTDGRNAFSKVFGIELNPTPEEMKQMRRKEVMKAMEILGVSRENILLFDFEDGKLANNIKKASTMICEIINKIHPAEIYYPHKKDRNCDHKTANLIITNCVKKLGFPICTYQYSLGRRFARMNGPAVTLSNFLRRNLIYVDVSPFLQQKAAALNEYKSQTTILCDRQKRSVVPRVKQFLKRYEVFYLN